MSKIGKVPVQLRGVTLTINGQKVTVTGQKGSLSFTMPESLFLKRVDESVVVSLLPKAIVRQNSALFGLTRATIANMVKGVAEGFEKKLELSGVGYRAQASSDTLTLSVGFSHPVTIQAPEGIAFSVADNTITVSGIDKSLVGEVAAKVRAIRPPEPYKGKGIFYVGERIRRKAGKAGKVVGVR